MKVLIDNDHSFAYAHGGIQELINNLLIIAPKFGIEVEPLRWWDSEQHGDIVHFFYKPNIPYLSLIKSKSKIVISSSLAPNLDDSLVKKNARKFFYLFAKFFLHGVSNSLALNLHEYALAALESEKKNVIITARDCPRDVLKYSDYRYWPLYIISRIVYSKANNLITVSPYVYDYIQKFNKNKISVIPNAVNNEVFKLKRNERIITNNNFTIVSALQWNRLKNAKNAIIAFSLFRKKIKNSRYLLIGRNLGENQQAQKWAQDNKLADGISFIGSIPYDDYIKEMQKADVYFHPSRTEACSMAISDALVMGIPVIGGRKNGGVPWQLQWGLGGLLTDVENHQSMAETLLEVYINKNDYLKNIIEAGHHWSEEWLKMEKVFTRYLSIYEKLKK